MSTHCAAVPVDLTLQQLVDEHILGSGQRCFLVTRGENSVGLMTLHRIKEGATSRLGDDECRSGHASHGTIKMHRA